MGEEKSLSHLSEKAQKDYELVQRATKNKDQQAFSDLMDKYKDPIYYMLLKMVNNNDDAEENEAIVEEDGEGDADEVVEEGVEEVYDEE